MKLCKSLFFKNVKLPDYAELRAESAIAMLERLGYTWQGGRWQPADHIARKLRELTPSQGLAVFLEPKAS